MTIKYNGQDLVRRIINGHDVEKVMYNGIQIRPSSPQPQPTYHIMGSFADSGASGQLPGGWYNSYGSVSYSSDGISLDTTGGTDHVIVKNQNSMPSLENASRIKIDYDFYRTNTGYTPSLSGSFFLVGGLSYNDGSISYARLQSALLANSNDGYVQLWTAGSTSQRDAITIPSVGKYTLSIDVDLMNKTVTQTLTYPNQTTSQSTGTITNSNVSSIRSSNEFTMSLFEGITMSDMNMYIRYNGTSETSDFTQGSMPSGWSTIQGNPTFDSHGMSATDYVTLTGPTPPDLSTVSTIIISYTYKVYMNGLNNSRSDIELNLEYPDPTRGFYSSAVSSHLIAMYVEDSPSPNQFGFHLDFGEIDDYDYVEGAWECNVITTIDLNNLIGETSVFDKNGNWLGTPVTLSITADEVSKIRASNRLSLQLVEDPDNVSYIENVSITYVI